MEENICVTVRLADRPDSEQPEPFFIEGSLKWRDLEAMLRALYETPQKEIEVRYLDDENDEVTLSRQEEFMMAITHCRDTENVLQLLVRSKMTSADATEGAFPAGSNGEAIPLPPPDSSTPEFATPMEDQEHMMVPGAASGANAVAIEMPECPMEVQEAADMLAEKQKGEVAETGEVTSTCPGTEGAEQADMAETGEVAHKSVRDAETGYWMLAGSAKKRKSPAADADKKEQSSTQAGAKAAVGDKQMAVMKNLKKRDRQTEVLAVKSEKRHKADKESKGELFVPGPVSGNMSFPDFVAFMGKLKKELRSEIVHDVTRKTVKQVLRGLETLQLQSGQQGHVTPQEGKTRANNWPVYTHDDILCDNCERTIVGPRYKCGNCLNYDLCEECENQVGVHDENHVFVKMRRPCQMAGYRHGKRAPLLKYLVYTTKIIEECPENETENNEQEHGNRDMEKLARKVEKLKHMQVKMKEKLAMKQEKLKRKCERLTTQVKEQFPAVKKEHSVPYGTLGADFVRDVTLPDGIIVQPGERLTKIWKMRNSGTMPWPAGSVLREMWSSMPSERSKVPVPQTAPGAEVDITVHFIAPTESGRYESHWRLHCNGRLVGHNVYCIVEVEKDLDTEKVDSESLPTEVPMLKELCSDNVGNLESKMTQLTVSDADQDVKQTEEPEEVQEDDASSEGDVEDKRCDGEEEIGSRLNMAGPMSVAGMNDLLSFVMVDVDRPERPRRPAPEVVKQSYEDKDFWAKKLSPLPGQGEPATPNNTPLDVSPPPERIVPIPEPELLRKLSLEAEASPSQEPDQLPPEVLVQKAAVPDSEVAGKSEAAQSSPASDVLSLENAAASPIPSPPVMKLSLDLLEPTPIGPHQEVDGEVLMVAEGSLQAGRHLYDEGELRPGQTPPSDLRWWEDRESSPASTASSVEVVSAGDLDVEVEDEKPTDLSDYMAQHSLFPPHGWTEDSNYDCLDVESLDSLSDEDSSIDEDFFIVKLPDCFDMSKPILYTAAPPREQPTAMKEYLVQQKTKDEALEATSAECPTEADEQEDASQTPSLDDMLQASGSIAAPTLIPTAAPASLQSPEGSDTAEQHAQGADNDSNVEAAAGEFQDAQEPTENEGAPSRQDDSAADATSAENVRVSGETLAEEAGGAEGGAAAGATGAVDDESLDPSQQVNQLMQSAVSVASKAAVRAFATAKDVFYTLQARQYEWKPSSWKPPQSSWKPPQYKWNPPQSEWKPPASTWKPPTEQWKPPSDDWKPPADDWKPPSDDWKPPSDNWKPPSDDWKPPSDEWQPPSDNLAPVHETECKEPLGESGVDDETDLHQASGPMARLWEMGFFNRTLNQELLDKHDGDLESVVRELLQEHDNNWAESRH